MEKLNELVKNPWFALSIIFFTYIVLWIIHDIYKKHYIWFKEKRIDFLFFQKELLEKYNGYLNRKLKGLVCK